MVFIIFRRYKTTFETNYNIDSLVAKDFSF
jgi:hypothetical protein